MALTGIALLALACCSSGVVRRPGIGVQAVARPVTRVSTRPNLLIFVVDDQRNSDTLSFMPKTSHWFISQGKNFTHAYDTDPLCCPARATMFSGAYDHNNNVHINLDSALLNQDSTVQHRLHAAGYSTAIVGKFLNAWPLANNPPNFDLWATIEGAINDPAGAEYTNPDMNVNGVIHHTTGYSTTLVGNYAVSYLKQLAANPGKPWLMFVDTPAPHYPWPAEPKYANLPVPPWPGNPAVAETDRSDKPPWVQSKHFTLAQAQEVHQGQLRALRSVDDMVDRVMTTVQQLKQTNTLALYLSDNGYLWAEHGLGGDYGTAAQKRYPYLPSVALPFLLRWPGHVPAGITDTRLVANADIAPTLYQAAGVTPDPKYPLDGRSLLGSSARKRLLLEYWLDSADPTVPSWASDLTPTYQYIEWYSGSNDATLTTFREYYDLTKDPWELSNLLGDHNPANDPNVAALSAQLRSDRGCRGNTGPGSCP
jgi:arylsulfatase A-like enzyme